MYDICMCWNKDCEKYDECRRGGLEKIVGVYTVSDLSSDCNKENNYAYFIGKDD